MKQLILPLLLLAACQNEPARDASAPAPPPPAAGGNAQRSEEAALETLGIGPVSARYDPDEFSRTRGEIELPPDYDRSVEATMLIGADRLSMMGKRECMYGQRGEPSVCTPGSEAGLAFAMLDEPFEQARTRFRSPPPEDMRLAGRDGISWEIGVEGEGAEYMLAPANGRSLLVVRRYRNRENPDRESIQAVLDSLSIEG